MNKTILVSSILLAMCAGSVSAASVYSENGVDVDVHGAAEVQIFQGHEFGDEKNDLDVRLDDGNLNFSTSVAINENLSAIGYFDFDFENGTHTNSDLYVGLKGKFGTLKAGRTITVFDDTGIDKSHEFGGASLGSVIVPSECPDLPYPTSDTQQPPQQTCKTSVGVVSYADGEDAIRYDLDLGKVYFAIGTDLQRNNDSQHVDGKIGAKFGNFDGRIFLQKGESSSGTDHDFDVDAQAVELEFNKDAVSFAAGYYNTENKYDSFTVGARSIQLAGSYTMDMTTFAAGVDMFESTKDAVDADGTNYYVTVTHKLHSNVKMYGEIGYTDTNESGRSENSFGYVAGLEVKF